MHHNSPPFSLLPLADVIQYALFGPKEYISAWIWLHQVYVACICATVRWEGGWMLRGAKRGFAIEKKRKRWRKSFERSAGARPLTSARICHSRTLIQRFRFMQTKKYGKRCVMDELVDVGFQKSVLFIYIDALFECICIRIHDIWINSLMKTRNNNSFNVTKICSILVDDIFYGHKKITLVGYILLGLFLLSFQRTNNNNYCNAMWFLFTLRILANIFHFYTY